MISPEIPIPRFAVVVVGGGAGSRFGSDLPKQFHSLGPHGDPSSAKPVAAWAMEAFLEIPEVEGLTPVMDPGLFQARLGDWRDALSDDFRRRLSEAVAGGKRRQDSVLLGLQSLPETVEIVAVHDAARPFPPIDAVKIAVSTVAGDPECMGAILALPVVDSVKFAEENGDIAHSLDRQRIWRAQTPQVFRRRPLMRALEALKNVDVTDEAQAVEIAGSLKSGALDDGGSPARSRVRLIPGDESNLKITTPGDLERAAALLD